MTVLPSSLVGKILASIWLTACASVLIFAFVNRDITDTDVVVLSAMLFLTLPTGMAFIGLVSLIVMALDSILGLTLPVCLTNQPYKLGQTVRSAHSMRHRAPRRCPRR